LFIATLIADGLTHAQVASAVDLLDSQTSCGAHHPWRWLYEGQAADISFAVDPVNARAVLEAELQQIDIIVQPEAGREKRLLVADMDSTMIQCECIDELADYAGLKPEIAAITEGAMRGELDFAQALDARVALLAGLDADVIDRCLAERVRATPGAATLVRTMRARGARCVLVSGGFTRFAEPVASMLGFDRAIANELLVEDGRLTGAVAKPIVGAETKLATLRAEAEAMGIGLDATLAVGDGANDLPMIRAAGLGVAYRAKPVVAAAAAARIERGDLTALLFAQGIGRDEWIEE
jgi:phosphoserine phosphatase